jgi:pimeloyl-ACP methyl ester carboxylesterase
MATFILVPGACHGGWCYETVTDRLRELGHQVYPVTLTGLSERRHLLTSTVNLDTHIQDVTGLIEAERITDAVLVGHSYGGMVLSGVADRLPELTGSPLPASPSFSLAGVVASNTAVGLEPLVKCRHVPLRSRCVVPDLPSGQYSPSYGVRTVP